MAVMRDVDFLRAAIEEGPPRLERALVYRYRSGILRPRVTAVLHELAQMQGTRTKYGELPLYTGFAEEGLINSLKLYIWPARTMRGFDADTLTMSLTSLAAGTDRPSVHFVKQGSEVARHPGWRAVERGALIIEEPALTRESLPSVLRYLAAATDLAPGVDLLDQPGFRESFTGLLKERAELPAIIQAFDERVLLCTDPATNRYDDARYRCDVVGRQARGALLSHLRDLVALRQECDLVDLLCGFDERRGEFGWTTHRLVAGLYRMTLRLLEPESGRRRRRSEARSRVAPYRVAEGAVLWAALLLAWEDALIKGVREDEAGYRRGPDLLVPALAGLGRDFLVREDRAEGGDPLNGRWPGVARALSRCGKDIPVDPGDPLERRAGPKP